MATTLTLGELRQRVRERADMEGSQFVTDAELTGYINQSAYELYDLLVLRYGTDQFVSSANITATGLADSFALPANFYKLLGVDLQVATDQWVSVRPFMFAERNRYPYPNIATFAGFTPTRYRLQGSNLWLMPRAPSGQVYRVWYVPRWTELAADSDVLEGISGWTEYVIIDAAIKCLVKEESDPSALMAAKAAMEKRIETAADNRDIAHPQRVQDVVAGDFGWSPGAGWPGGWGS